ncbi:MAG TPA: hypothetical protein VFZ91_12720 [Allosphingosinicella sp.]
MTTFLRYLLYIAFVFAAVIFWLLVAVFFLGFSMGDPACLAEGTPCPRPAFLEQAAKTLTPYAAMPLTALVFVFYRRAVRRMVELD